VILSSDTNPDDKSNMRETSGSMDVRNTSSPTTSTDV